MAFQNAARGGLIFVGAARGGFGFKGAEKVQNKNLKTLLKWAFIVGIIIS